MVQPEERVSQDWIDVYVPDDVELDGIELERVLTILADHLDMSSPMVVSRRGPASGAPLN